MNFHTSLALLLSTSLNSGTFVSLFADAFRGRPSFFAACDGAAAAGGGSVDLVALLGSGGSADRVREDTSRADERVAAVRAGSGGGFDAPATVALGGADFVCVTGGCVVLAGAVLVGAAFGCVVTVGFDGGGATAGRPNASG